MKVIYLTQEKIALVDDENFEELNRHKWYASKDGGGDLWYAVRNTGKYPNQRPVKMHRIIMNTPTGMMTDHLNGNGLDNRKQNMRNCTNSINALNRHKLIANKTSKFQGVSWKKENKQWQATLEINGQSRYLGYFKTEEEANRKYEKTKAKLLEQKVPT